MKFPFYIISLLISSCLVLCSVAKSGQWKQKEAINFHNIRLPDREKNPKLQSLLSNLLHAYQKGGLKEAINFSNSQNIRLKVGADIWQGQGYNGQGTKVAIVDLGFQGYEDLLGTELPDSVVARSFRADGDITGGGEVHGSGCAEIVHDVAPSAQLYLINFSIEERRYIFLD